MPNLKKLLNNTPEALRIREKIMKQNPLRFLKQMRLAFLAQRLSKIKFPSIYRTIPERFIQKLFVSPVFLTAFACGFLFMAIAIMGNDLRGNWKELNGVTNERRLVDSQISAWEKLVTDFPEYKDGYLVLAGLEYQLGRKQKASEYISKALQIDPDYIQALELQAKIIGS